MLTLLNLHLEINTLLSEFDLVCHNGFPEGGCANGRQFDGIVTAELRSYHLWDRSTMGHLQETEADGRQISGMPLIDLLMKT